MRYTRGEIAQRSGAFQKKQYKLDQGRICGQMRDVSTGKGKSSYYTAMPRARGLKFYYVIADLKVDEEHICTKFSKFNSFQVTSDFTHVSEKSKSRCYSLSY